MLSELFSTVAVSCLDVAYLYTAIPLPLRSVCLDRQCPPGHACPYGAVEPTICAPGTYQPLPFQASCEPCPAGKHYILKSGVSKRALCFGTDVFILLGFYCLEGSSAPLPCPAGTWSMIEGLSSRLDCAPCPPGFYCNVSGLTRPSGLCFAGHLHRDQKFPLVCSSGIKTCFFI